MGVKQSAQSLLYIILFSQSFSLVSKLLTEQIPPFEPRLLMLMIACGLLGGMLGQRIHRTIRPKTLRSLYISFIVLTICINIYNIYLLA